MEALVTATPVNTMLFSAVLVLLKIVLGMRVTAYRIKNETMWGDNADIRMQRLIRAHGNHAEWMPAAIIILALITGYCSYILSNRRLTAMMFGILALLYGFFYSLLQLQDYALLLGSLGLLLILATIMYLTRNIDWYALRGEEE